MTLLKAYALPLALPACPVPTTFQQASVEKARSWVRELQRQADPSIVIALCGNKTDLAARRQVTQEEAQKYAEEEGLMWMEASAKTGEGVQDIFMTIGTCALRTSTILARTFVQRTTALVSTTPIIDSLLPP